VLVGAKLGESARWSRESKKNPQSLQFEAKEFRLGGVHMFVNWMINVMIMSPALMILYLHAMNFMLCVMGLEVCCFWCCLKNLVCSCVNMMEGFRIVWLFMVPSQVLGVQLGLNHSHEFCSLL